MTALSDRIAAEHALYRCTEDGGTGVYGQPVEVYVGYQCECGWTTKDSAATSHHIADVTERAVAEAIAQEIEDQEAILRSYVDFTNDEREIGLINGYRRAARIAREGTTP